MDLFVHFHQLKQYFYLLKNNDFQQFELTKSWHCEKGGGGVGEGGGGLTHTKIFLVDLIKCKNGKL